MAQVKPNIIKVENEEKLAQEALSRFIESAQKAASANGVFRVAISGGQTPAAFYKLLAEKDAYSQIDWNQVHLFWVDERCVPPDHEAGNYGLAVRTFLREIPIPSKNVHRIRGENPDSAAAAKEYEQTLLKVFGIQPGQIPKFDLIILGLGADGHIGSLFPNTDALFNRKNLVCPVYHAPDGLNRITLTIPVIQQAMQIVILVSSQPKSEIVRRVFQSEPNEKKYPVHFLWPVMSEIIWIIDRPAASLIPQRF